MASILLCRMNTFRVRPIPFYKQASDEIIYTTTYNAIHENLSGIFQYDIYNNKHKIIKKWNQFDQEYYPGGYIIAYNEISDEIFFVGGCNMNNNEKDTDILSIYNMKTEKITHINFNRLIGGNSRAIFASNNDPYTLHIVCGEKNKFHIMYNILTNKTKIIHSFTQIICNHGLLYHKSTNKLILFGIKQNPSNIIVFLLNLVLITICIFQNL